MPIPNANAAFVPPEKVTDYLLDEQHPVGKSKAKWFSSLGYDVGDSGRLEKDLLKLVQSSEDYAEKASSFGTKYVVSGRITSPSGRDANVTTVWIIESSGGAPRLVTAYPGERP
jgi:hypothetical protein